MLQPAQQHPQQQTLLRQRDVTARTGMPRTSIYAAMLAGKFPRPVKVGARAVAWVSTEIDAWTASRPRVSA